MHQPTSNSAVVLIDTHCHLDAEAFEQDLDEVLDRAAENGVERMLTIGITLETSLAAIVLANRHPQISAVIGIQPNYVQDARPGDWERIVELATDVVAVFRLVPRSNSL